MDVKTLQNNHPQHWRYATAIRALALDAVAAAKSGHTGMPLGMADVATVLWSKHLRYHADTPDWPDRDRFVLSAGHGSMLLYALLYLTGHPKMTLEAIKNFRQLGSVTAGHPEYGHAPGIETTTGPLGQGIATAIGMAIAEENHRARYGKKIVDHHTYVIAGDGCLMEGVSQEAIGLAGKLKLSKLIVLWDDNGITIDGAVSMADVTDQKARFKASGWSVLDCDGHDPDAIDAALTAAKTANKPTLIACKTHIAIGHAAQDTARGHGALTDADELKAAKEVYGWEHAAFDIPRDVKSWWEAAGARGAEAYTQWTEQLGKISSNKRKNFEREISGVLPKSVTSALKKFKQHMSAEAPKIATRKSSEKTLAIVTPLLPEIIAGSADLTGSNNTKTGDLAVFDPENRAGRYIHYGIREHGMAAAMNGIALHGGAKAYGGTFLVFSDYARPAMRLSALMGLPVTYVMTHDSIGLGEDGPTHQPIEHLAMLRATPNLHVFRPCDAIETAEAWELALGAQSTPSVLALSRQGLPTLRTQHSNKNLTAQGAYVLAEAVAKRQVILLATGSEVAIAMAAKEALEQEGIGTRVVSMPCWALFEQSDESYRRRVLPNGAVRIGIEAGVRQGWDRWLCGERGRESKAGFVGLNSFGASAPADVLFEHFGLTPQAVVAQVKSLL